MKLHSLKTTLLFLATLALPALGYAESTPRGEHPFTEHGIVDTRLQDGVLVISDSTYHVTDQTKIHKYGGKTATLGELKQGTKVGFNMYGTRAQRYLAEVWILPSGFDFKSLADE